MTPLPLIKAAVGWFQFWFKKDIHLSPPQSPPCRFSKGNTGHFFLSNRFNCSGCGMCEKCGGKGHLYKHCPTRLSTLLT